MQKLQYFRGICECDGHAFDTNVTAFVVSGTFCWFASRNSVSASTNSQTNFYRAHIAGLHLGVRGVHHDTMGSSHSIIRVTSPDRSSSQIPPTICSPFTHRSSMSFTLLASRNPNAIRSTNSRPPSVTCSNLAQTNRRYRGGLPYGLRAHYRNLLRALHNNKIHLRSVDKSYEWLEKDASKAMRSGRSPHHVPQHVPRALPLGLRILECQGYL